MMPLPIVATMTLAQWQLYTYIFGQIVGYIADLNGVSGLSDEECDEYMIKEREIKASQRVELDNL